MVKTFEQINREFLEEYFVKKTEPAPEANVVSLKKKNAQRRKKSVKPNLNILPYAVFVFTMFTLMIFSGVINRNLNLFGYSGFTVLSRSMQSEIPEGSLIIVKKTGPEKINVGDDITFTRKRDAAIVTHRVIQVFRDSGENGGIKFQTQGVDNPDPDQDAVHADAIIGYVTLIIPGIGTVLNFLTTNAGFLFVFFGGVTLIAITTKKFLNAHKKFNKRTFISPNLYPLGCSGNK